MQIDVPIQRLPRGDFPQDIQFHASAMSSGLYDDPGSPELGDDPAGRLGCRTDDGGDIVAGRQITQAVWIVRYKMDQETRHADLR